MSRPCETELGNMYGKAIVVASHPRSGTHLLIDLLRRQFPACRGWRLWGLPLDHLYLNAERIIASKRRFDDRLALKILSRARKPIIKTHAFAGYGAWIFKDESGELPEYWLDFLEHPLVRLYIYRDPRRVMASYHAFLKGVDSNTKYSSLGEFIRQENAAGQSRLHVWTAHVKSWLAAPDVIKIKMEDCLNDPLAAINEIALAINEKPVLKRPLLPAKTSSQKSRLGRLTLLRPASTAIIARNFPVEHWKTALNKSDRLFFQQTAGDLLRDLGYEDSAEWVYQQ